MLAVIYASQDCYLTVDDALGSSPIDNQFLKDTYFIPKGHAITVVLDGTVANVRGLDTAGIIHIQFIERWAGMGLDINTYRI